MTHELPQALVLKVLNYLALRPYGEVAELISEVHGACQAKPADEPVPEPKKK